jgi:hypothetical protein
MIVTQHDDGRVWSMNEHCPDCPAWAENGPEFYTPKPAPFLTLIDGGKNAPEDKV